MQPFFCYAFNSCRQAVSKENCSKTAATSQDFFGQSEGTFGLSSTTKNGGRFSSQAMSTPTLSLLYSTIVLHDMYYCNLVAAEKKDNPTMSSSTAAAKESSVPTSLLFLPPAVSANGEYVYTIGILTYIHVRALNFIKAFLIFYGF